MIKNSVLKLLMEVPTYFHGNLMYFMPSLSEGTLRRPDPVKDESLYPLKDDFEPVRFIVFPKPGYVIPIHCHPEHGGMRKIYVHNGNGVVWVWREGPRGGFDKHILKAKGDSVEIRPGYEHAAACLTVSDPHRPCELMVRCFCTIRQDNRVNWESMAHNLVMNKHVIHAAA